MHHVSFGGLVEFFKNRFELSLRFRFIFCFDSRQKIFDRLFKVRLNILIVKMMRAVFT